jgi:hypothetical protein
MNDVVHFPTPHDEDDRYKTALASAWRDPEGALFKGTFERPTHLRICDISDRFSMLS